MWLKVDNKQNKIGGFYLAMNFFIYTGCPKKNGDSEFWIFFCCVRALLYDHFQEKSTSKSKLGVFSFETNFDLLWKWSYNRALTKLQKVENSKSPFFWGHPVLERAFQCSLKAIRDNIWIWNVRHIKMFNILLTIFAPLIRMIKE